MPRNGRQEAGGRGETPFLRLWKAFVELEEADLNAAIPSWTAPKAEQGGMGWRIPEAPHMAVKVRSGG